MCHLSQRRQAVRTRDAVVHMLRSEFAPAKLLTPTFSGALSHFVLDAERIKVWSELVAAGGDKAKQQPKQQQQQKQQEQKQ